MSSRSSNPGMRGVRIFARRIRNLTCIACTAAIAFLGTAGSADAVPLTFTDKAQWLSHLASATDFSLDASNVALANEIATPPAANALLGNLLTFEAGNTGLPFGFTFAVDTPEVGIAGNTIIYIENIVGNGLGVATNSSEHDWIVNFSDPVFILGMTVRGGGSFDDGIRYLDSSGGLLPGFASPPNPAFFGIISDTPIGGFLYDDSNVSGGRVLIELSTGTLSTVPEPGSLEILALGLIGLCAARRRRVKA